MINLARVEAVVRAVLYEGYILYPYRPSSVKNRQRWTFGGVYPRDFAEAEGSVACRMQTQCLLQGGLNSDVDVHVRFLHVVRRDVGQLNRPVAELPAEGEPPFALVPSLKVGEIHFHAWEEALERQVVVPSLTIEQLLAGPAQIPFRFLGARELEPLRAANRSVAGVLIRSHMMVEGEITIAAKEIAPDVFQLTVQIDNLTPIDAPSQMARDEIQLRALTSTHTILGLRNAEFVSLLDPPAELKDAAAACNNQGTWPVLAGEPGEKDILLSSPIILYDYPQVAPESPGDLFDSTEIDEILTLRILAMTDEEKREMAAADERGRALLKRTEALTAADMARLHGTLRNPSFVSAQREEASAQRRAPKVKPELAFLHVAGCDLKIGDRVRLRPKSGADIMDIVLKDEVAIIEAIERDFEDKVHVAVVLESDPGREFGLDRMPGHRFFFSPDELEVMAKGN
jgi:hypothetical protein